MNYRYYVLDIDNYVAYGTNDDAQATEYRYSDLFIVIDTYDLSLWTDGIQQPVKQL